ncbi:hypothetical protein ACFQH6_12485 [Halobacteriaceae archaeon GCM10025711]
MGGAFRSVTQLLEHWERRRWDVASVEGSDAPASDELTVDVELRTPLHEAFDATDDAIGLRSATVDGDGALRLDVVASSPLVPPALRRDDLSVAVGETHATGGDLVVVVSVQVSTSDGGDVEDGFDGRGDAGVEEARTRPVRPKPGPTATSVPATETRTPTTGESSAGTRTSQPSTTTSTWRPCTTPATRSPRWPRR